jgi:hypothetical protein
VNPNAAAITFGRIWVDESYFRKQSFVDQGILMRHEYKHVAQQQKFGLLKWGLKYLFSGMFRVEQEIDAYTVEMAQDRLEGYTDDQIVEFYAREVSGATYLWPMDLGQARRLVREALNRI